MKKLVLLGLVLSVNSFAADNSLAITSCTLKNGVNYCTLGANGVLPPQQIQKPATNTQLQMPNTVDPQKSLDALANVQQNQGQYNAKVPGGNSFIFCMGGRPSRYNPLRPVYDSVCDAGDASKVKAPPVPDLIDPATGKPVSASQITLNPTGVTTPVVKDGIVVSNTPGIASLTPMQQEQINIINNNATLTPEERQMYLNKVLAGDTSSGTVSGTIQNTTSTTSVFK